MSDEPGDFNPTAPPYGGDPVAIHTLAYAAYEIVWLAVAEGTLLGFEAQPTRRHGGLFFISAAAK